MNLKVSKQHKKKKGWGVDKKTPNIDRSCFLPALTQEFESRRTSTAELPAIPTTSRIFDLEPFAPSKESLHDLSLGMVVGSNADSFNSKTTDSLIPAGYTYLAQYIDHDMSYHNSARKYSTERSNSKNYPTLDLCSLYGDGPEVESFYETDGIRLRIGKADKSKYGAVPDLPNDLPRIPTNHKISEVADIGEYRNDKNLAVAQTHLAFLKFHNMVTDDPYQPNTLEDIKNTVRQHFQSLVFYDFLPRLIDSNTFEYLDRNGRKWIPNINNLGETTPVLTELPVEFSAAAFCLGHTMIRGTYHWNRVFRTGGSPAGPITQLDLANFTETAGDFTSNLSETSPIPRLPSNRIVNWLLMYDFSKSNRVKSDPDLNFSRKLGPVLNKSTDELDFPENLSEHSLQLLAYQNLVNGSAQGLPSGQDVSELLGIRPLIPNEISNGPFREKIRRHGFDKKTPLWYYILKEAEVNNSGNCLGGVGSTIVGETVHAVLENSEHSIFSSATDWCPTITSIDPKYFSMVDLLLYVNELNPLGMNY